MITEGAFVGDVGFRMQVPGPIRAGLYTIAASHAIFIVYQNHAIPGGEGGPHGTNLHAWRIGAMIA
jgi:hypothetical protein